MRYFTAEDFQTKPESRTGDLTTNMEAEPSKDPSNTKISNEEYVLQSSSDNFSDKHNLQESYCKNLQCEAIRVEEPEDDKWCLCSK